MGDQAPLSRRRNDCRCAIPVANGTRGMAETARLRATLMLPQRAFRAAFIRAAAHEDHARAEQAVALCRMAANEVDEIR